MSGSQLPSSLGSLVVALSLSQNEDDDSPSRTDDDLIFPLRDPRGSRWIESSADQKTSPSETVDYLASTAPAVLSEDALIQVERDVPRTFPELAHCTPGSTTSASLSRLLTAISVSYSDVGYVQGMNFICAFLLFHSKSDDGAFLLFRRLMEGPRYNMQRLYRSGLALLMHLCDALEFVLRERFPAVMLHLEVLGVDVVLFAQNWFMTLFSYQMPLPVLADVWDLFFRVGWRAIVAAAVVLVETRMDAVLNCTFEGAVRALKAASANPPRDLAARAARVEFSEAQLSRILTIDRQR